MEKENSPSPVLLRLKISHPILSFLMLAICLCFYLFFAFYDGAVICVDSPGYISMRLSREPFYPLLLAFFRKLFSSFPNDFYLTAVAFFQSILMAAATWTLVRYIWKELRLPRLIAFLSLLMPLAVSFLCRFAAKRESMYSNSILTEGIAISLYLLFFRYLLEYCIHQSKKSLLLSSILVFIMISTRKQMFVTLALLVLCILIVNIVHKKAFRGILVLSLCTLAIVGSATLLDMGYNYTLRGNAVRHTNDNRFITTMAFYTAERSDAAYINDEEVRDVFLEVYDVCDQKGYLKHSAEEGWFNRVTHFGDYYDCIQINTMGPIITQYVQEHYEGGEVELGKKVDQIMSTINISVMPHNAMNILGSFLDNVLSGLITTVAKRNILLNWYSFFIYIIYILLLIWNIRVRGHIKTAVLAGLTLLAIIGNVTLVSLVIFCQTRYTIYNMGLFYICLIIMLYNLIRHEHLLHITSKNQNL